MGFPTKNDHFGVFWGYHWLLQLINMNCAVDEDKMWLFGKELFGGIPGKFIWKLKITQIKQIKIIFETFHDFGRAD